MHGVGEAVANPVATHAVGWSITSIGVWVSNTLIAGALAVVLKFLSTRRKQTFDRGDQLDDERRQDMIAMRVEIAQIRSDARDAQKRAATAEAHLAAAMALIRLLHAKAHFEWPDDPIVKAAGRLIEDVSSDVIPNEMLALVKRLRDQEGTKSD